MDYLSRTEARDIIQCCINEFTISNEGEAFVLVMYMSGEPEVIGYIYESDLSYIQAEIFGRLLCSNA